MSGPQDGDSPRRRPAGPVAGEDTSSSQAAGEEPSPTPPAGDASAEAAQGRRAADSPGAVQDLEADFEQLLADTQRERDEYLDLARRTKADFENFRKRMGAEVQAAAARGKAEVIREVVPVVDDLERAIEAAGLDPEGDSPDGLAHGVLLVFRRLRETLARIGVEAVDPAGEAFDPEMHEALSTQPAPDAEPGTVVEVVEKGYHLGDQLIRPARVVVAE
jgi:molecular chaperone GrpE